MTKRAARIASSEIHIARARATVQNTQHIVRRGGADGRRGGAPAIYPRISVYKDARARPRYLCVCVCVSNECLSPRSLSVYI